MSMMRSTNTTIKIERVRNLKSGNLERDESTNCLCSLLLNSKMSFSCYHCHPLPNLPLPHPYYLKEGSDLGVLIVTVVKPILLQKRQY